MCGTTFDLFVCNLYTLAECILISLLVCHSVKETFKLFILES